MPVKHFRLAEHPWLSLLTVVLSELVGLVLFSGLVIGLFKQPPDTPMTQCIVALSTHLAVLFVLVPFVLGLPDGRRSFHAYMDAIRLSRVQPLFRLLFLGLSCYLILALCQVCGTLVYRVREGNIVAWPFVRGILDLTSQLPPKSWDILFSFPSVFEEVAFRGVILSLFLTRYSKPTSVVIAALSFGMLHLTNLTTGQELALVLGQAVWATILGLFYGVVVLKSNSLWPAMLVHYLGNLFQAPFTWYVQTSASAQTRALYGIIFSFGLVPTILMILWVLLFTALWPIVHEKVGNAKVA
jgi:membrane protease YdiL (CAAX protease family)